VDAFVDKVLTELAAMAADGTRSTRSGPKPTLTGAALRKVIMAKRLVAEEVCAGDVPVNVADLRWVLLP
jgi:hypothetical protein